MNWNRSAVPSIAVTLALLVTSSNGVAQITGAIQSSPPAYNMSFGWVSTEVVKDAPYSADAITETTQVLSDRNRIVRKTVARIYRDSEGRTRREQTIQPLYTSATPGDAPRTISIQDPVARVNYVLDPQNKTAQKIAFSSPEVVPSSRASAGALASNRQLKPPQYSQAATQPLGTETIEGLEAEGTRSTTLIPAGEVGNERPIEIASERWYSLALHIPVLIKSNDPRFGEILYRLTNISLQEPDASLFQIPPDYTVQESPRSGSGFFRRLNDAEQDRFQRKTPEE